MKDRDLRLAVLGELNAMLEAAGSSSSEAVLAFGVIVARRMAKIVGGAPLHPKWTERDVARFEQWMKPTGRKSTNGRHRTRRS